MTEHDSVLIDELGPVDYVVLEFPVGEQNFNGGVADELLRLSQAGIIRILDVILMQKNEDGSVDAVELDEAVGLDDLRILEADLAEILAEEDVVNLATAMEAGSVALALVWENAWAAPFASAARHAGGQLVASGRIPIQAIAASMEAASTIEEGN